MNKGQKIVVYSDGTVLIYFDGLLHYENGPAVIGAHGIRKHYFKGLLHRKGGPAVTWPDGTFEWWTHGVQDHVTNPNEFYDSGS